ncbi:hypothetical protein H072_9953 [Dactylellina haptotyla CBS 200.50]|uniref:Chromosome segregation in meiosis protein n=1 Tax=Dactylellina haptotyla (strain CBS 200.50) TaxID=1284197 RepID=S8A0K9_DACHA|nr:hypothetical protein H072_9953 [Dactylellina haptotyla CBS 200.50]
MADIDVDDDELDDLFGYDIDDIETTVDPQARSQQAQAVATNENTLAKGKEKDDGGLGVDQEIKIRKRKAPTALTEEMLLGPKGIPYLQEHASKKIKFKGKGHELSDIGRLLKFYQIWADNLYPKAQFRDAINIIEKLGSSRGMQRRREDWITEYKLKQTTEEDRLVSKARELLAIDSQKEYNSQNEYDTLGRLVLRIRDTSNQSGEQRLASQLREPARPRVDNEDSLFFEDDDDDDFDELDNILKGAENPKAPVPAAPPQTEIDEFDELDAILAEMDGNPGSKNNVPSISQLTGPPADFDDEFEEAMEAMREMEG